MAATISATPDTITVRAAMFDSMGEDANKIFVLDGTLTDEEITDFLDWYNILTNAAFGKISVSSSRLVTGMRSTPVQQLYNLVANFLVLTFERVHPLNAAKTIRKSFLIPAIRVLAVNADGTPFVGTPDYDTPTNLEEYMGNLVEFLEDHLVYEDITGDITVGGWTYESSLSSLATGSAVIDGQ